jgi:hypothetical protein
VRASVPCLRGGGEGANGGRERVCSSLGTAGKVCARGDVSGMARDSVSEMGER